MRVIKNLSLNLGAGLLEFWCGVCLLFYFRAGLFAWCSPPHFSFHCLFSDLGSINSSEFHVITSAIASVKQGEPRSLANIFFGKQSCKEEMRFAYNLI